MSRLFKRFLNSSGGMSHTSVGVGQWVEVPSGIEDANIEVILSPAVGSAVVEVHGTNIGGTPSDGSLLVKFVLSATDPRGSLTKSVSGYTYMCMKTTSISGGAAVEGGVGG